MTSVLRNRDTRTELGEGGDIATTSQVIMLQIIPKPHITPAKGSHQRPHLATQDHRLSLDLWIATRSQRWTLAIMEGVLLRP